MYFQSSSEIQADGLQTLYLMNPNFAHYSDTQNNSLFLNPAAVPPHAPPHHNQHFVGIPLSHDPNRPSPVLEIPAAQTPAPRHHYYAWGSTDQSASGNNHEQPNIPLQTPRGLSLSLSAHHQTAAGIISPPSEKESNGVNTMQSMIIGSKYLKAAQELLDEVANVGNESKAAAPPEAAAAAARARDKAKAIKEANEFSYKTEISAAQRQEMQMKKAKLNSMLDEVEQRCRQYHHQMHAIVTTFEQAAGVGSARAYTHLALKTILKQFRCLKSTIASQIKGLSRSLGEEEIAENKLEGSRLKFVDTRLQQARAIQQMGMMQGNAWRPQRGLPERAVSVLRTWLFEHFLHPYPKDSDKQMLAKQTGLSRSQVSNWFINARVRLWKPMVEEMYLEETKTQDPITDPSIKPEPDNHPPGSAPSPPQISPSTLTASPPGFSLPPRTNVAQLITSLNQKNPKKPRTAIDLSPEISGGGDQKNYLSTADANLNRYGFGEFGADQHLAAAGFQGSAAFSLSLSLPPAEQQFLSHRSFGLGTQIDSGAVEGNRMNEDFEMIDFQNRKPFPAQLLPDFVA